MNPLRAMAGLPAAASGGRPLPRAARVGGLIIALGLLVDLVEHTLLAPAPAGRLGTFSLGEHLAHLVVLVGMVVVLVAIVADGVGVQRRASRAQRPSRPSRVDRPQGGIRDALR